MFFLTEGLCIFSTISPASSKSGSCPQVPRSQRHVLVPLRAEVGTQAWEKIMCSNLLTNYSEEMKHQLLLPGEGEKARLRGLLCCSLLWLLFSEKPIPGQAGTAPPALKAFFGPESAAFTARFHARQLAGVSWSTHQDPASCQALRILYP